MTDIVERLRSNLRDGCQHRISNADIQSAVDEIDRLRAESKRRLDLLRDAGPSLKSGYHGIGTEAARMSARDRIKKEIEE